MTEPPRDPRLELTVAEVETILAWCNAADFEGRVDEDELPLVGKLAESIGTHPLEYATWCRSRMQP